MDFKEFTAIPNQEAWSSAVQKILKGVDINSLNWNINEQISLTPYYKQIDAPLALKVPVNNDDCKVRHSIIVDSTSLTEKNKWIISLLEQGTQSLQICWKITPSQVLFKKILDGVHLSMIQLHQEVYDFADWTKLLSIIDQQDAFPKDIQGSIIYNTNSIDEHANTISYLAKNQILKKYAHIRFFELSSHTKNELPELLHDGHQIVKKALDNDISMDDITARIQFVLTVNTSLIESIANIKAFRILWSFIVKNYHPQHECSVYTYIITKNNTEKYLSTSPLVYNNLLAQTTQAMAAIMGTSDEHQIDSFDPQHELEKNFSNRISRNVMHLLKEESFLSKSKDPLRGAYAVEVLIKQTAEVAWNNFLQLEQ